MPKIGITTTIPIEIVFAAGFIPVDLNNLFISQESLRLVHQAEMQGFPRNFCAWIKGIYSVVLNEGISHIIAVTQGDCSNTHALIETLMFEGVKVTPFAYPYDRDKDLLKLQMERILQAFHCSWPDVINMKKRLDKIREKVHKIDHLTWKKGIVTGEENNYFLLSCSDMQSDLTGFSESVDNFLGDLDQRKPFSEELRLGYIGVPPIFSDLYSFTESQGARVVFNEIQRQFAMPGCLKEDNLVEQYLKYTYPYDIFARIADIKEQVKLRRIDGIIHYVQSFCFHRLEDLIIRRSISTPILTLEGDNPGKLDARTKIRLESFLQMMKERKK